MEMLTKMNYAMKDCGFTQETAKQYKDAIEADNYSKQIQVLEKQRKLMLDEMHAAAKKLDCIDFLISECKKKISEK